MSTMTDRLSPARPVTLKRQWWHNAQLAVDGADTHVWQWGFVKVLSSRTWTEYQGEFCWHNHVSVSVDPRIGDRPVDKIMGAVREDFDMVDAEEDNHQPGRIRNLFLPLHLARGTVGVCDCKSDETTVVEPDGFTWSRSKAST